VGVPIVAMPQHDRPRERLLRLGTDALSGRELVTPHFSGERCEKLLVLVCDARNGVPRVERITDGASDRSMVPVREVLNAVLRHDGRAFAVAHNHPSGDPTPSVADEEATQNLRSGAAATGLRFLGHVVVAGAEWREVTGRR
jgi:DNA repair protein RadC